MVDAIATLFPYVAKTAGITVRVAVSYLPEQSAPSADRWFWSYHIRIENERETPVQLLSRHWIITDGQGDVHEVQGEGVVGEMPVIESGGRYDYVSGCPLSTASGSMEGSYRFVDAEGALFNADIPYFQLNSPR